MSRGSSSGEAARASVTATRQTQGLGSASQMDERVIGAVVERMLNQKYGDLSTTLERVQVLLGERGNNDRRAALTRGDLPTGVRPVSRLAAAPTADDYNILADAVNDLLAALSNLAS